MAAAYAFGGKDHGSERSIAAAQEGLVSEEYGLLEFFARLAGTEHMRYRVIPE